MAPLPPRRLTGLHAKRVRARRLLLPLLAMIAGTAPAAALPIHQLASQQWFLEDGLPQASAAALAFDHRGFLWVGTQDGLARFDGSRFRVFSAEATPGLLDDNIAALLFDAGGRLWIGSKSGLTLRVDTGFRAIESPGVLLGSVFELHPASDGSVLVAAGGGGFRATVDGRLRAVDGLPPGSVFAIAGTGDDARGETWFGRAGRVDVLGADGLRQVALPAGATSAVKEILHGCGATWLGTLRGLYRVTAAGGVQPVEDVPANNVNSLYCAGEELWIGTARGIYRLRDGVLRESVEDEDRFPHLWVNQFLPGPSGAIWIGTLSGGIYRLSEARYLRYNERDGIGRGPVWAVQEGRDGAVWFANGQGIWRRQADRFERVLATEALGGATVLTLHETDRGDLWIGTRSGVLRLESDATEPERILDEPAAGVVQDQAGTVWIGGFSGLYRFDGGAGLAGPLADLPTDRLRALHPSSGHGLLVGSEHGAWRRTGGDFERIDARAEGTAGGFVTSFLEHGGDALWIGYAGGGLKILRGDRTAHYRQADGLLSDTIYQLRHDERGDVWVSTAEGVFRVPASSAANWGTPGADLADVDVVLSLTGKAPGSSAGYCCNGGATAASALDGTGHLWLPTIDGLVRIDTSDRVGARPAPRVFIDSVTVGDLSYDTGVAAVVLPPDGDRAFTARFTAPSYERSGQLAFAYRLHGWDDRWRAAEERLATFTNLPPGSYRLEVRAGAPGPGEASTAALTVTVPPRWYEVPLARVAAILAVALAIVAFLRWRIRRFEANERRLEATIAARTRELAVANQRLERLSRTDALTGLENRRALAEHIEALLAGSTASALAMIDIDHFKQINDRFGHAVGDRVLQRVAARLRAEAREGDLTVRWGGEELLLVAADVPPDALTALADRLLAKLNAPLSPEEGTTLPAVVTCSVGWCAFPLLADDEWTGALEIADWALFEAKRRGRAQWVAVLPGEAPAGMTHEELLRRLDRREAREVRVAGSQPEVSGPQQ